MGRRKVKWLSAPGSKTSSIPLKNPKSQGGKEEGGVEGQPGARGGGEKARGKRYRMGRQGIKGLKTRVGRECSISTQRTRLYSGGINVGGARGESHNVSSGDTAGRGS